MTICPSILSICVPAQAFQPLGVLVSSQILALSLLYSKSNGRNEPNLYE